MLFRRGKNGNQIGRSDIQKRQQRLKQKLILSLFFVFELRQIYVETFWIDLPCIITIDLFINLCAHQMKSQRVYVPFKMHSFEKRVLLPFEFFLRSSTPSQVLAVQTKSLFAIFPHVKMAGKDFE